MVFYGLNGELSKHTASPVMLPRAIPGGSTPCAGTAKTVEFHPFSVTNGLDNTIRAILIPEKSPSTKNHL
jgi:hypothetical protein